MPSAVGICNSALIKLGVERITSLDDTNKQARLCKEQYDKLRLEVLREHPWKFARKRAQLVATIQTPVWEWAYSLQLPTDCLRIIKTDLDTPYAIEGRLLLSDDQTLNVLYIADIQDASLFDAGFCEALASRLAKDLAYSLVQSVTLKQLMDAEYKQALKAARLASAQEGTPEHIINDYFIDSRLAGGPSGAV